VSHSSTCWRLQFPTVSAAADILHNKSTERMSATQTTKPMNGEQITFVKPSMKFADKLGFSDGTIVVCPSIQEERDAKTTLGIFVRSRTVFFCLFLMLLFSTASLYLSYSSLLNSQDAQSKVRAFQALRTQFGI
jgi:hypothetical protein